ncbi:hypothetical protein E4625_09665 [Aeromonas hydrophila]|uniref:hypothetical protein n=1 Tax=Aeromonas hydrophila TaxID=644 RepID=UPI000FD16B15|nr:hypothetical protein [Aeromonas hydrophila]AZU48394.1 hypothetical protein C3B79_2636 [Aeromonas hydrophila]QBX71078.1 hypothetical protein E4625_09665 [Aeromonas hydrophila]
MFSKQDFFEYFIETNEKLETVIDMVSSAYREAEEVRKKDVIEKLKLFAEQNNMSFEAVKALFSNEQPKPEKKKGTQKEKFYVRYGDADRTYYAYRTLGGKQDPILKSYLESTGKTMKDLVIDVADVPKEFIPRLERGVCFLDK